LRIKTYVSVAAVLIGAACSVLYLLLGIAMIRSSPGTGVARFHGTRERRRGSRAYRKQAR
jgi:hypothetical protein